jgi:hypothetical protein
MPLPLLPILGAGLSAVGGIVGNIMNNRSQNKANQQNIEFQREMYNRQRQDSLSDWNMQNEYNSPEAQMRRLKEGGLNPNLVYGQGAVANNTQGVRSSSGANANIAPTRVDPSFIGDSVNQYFNVQRQEKSLKLLEEEIKNKQADTLQKIEQPDYIRFKKMNLNSSTVLNNVKSDQMEQMFTTLMDTKKALIRSMNAGTEYKEAQTLTENKTRDTKFLLNVENILKSRADQSKSYKEIQKIDEVIKQIRKNVSESENSVSFGALGKFGYKVKDDGYIMNYIDPDWKNKSDYEREKLIKKLSEKLY